MENETVTNAKGFSSRLDQSNDLKTALVHSVTLPCCLIGIPGNLLIIITLLRGDCGLSKSARLCYTVIATADTLTLTAYAMRALPYLIPEAKNWPTSPHSSLMGCIMSRWLTGFGVGISKSVLTILCAERTYYVYKPLDSKKRSVFKISVASILAASAFQSALHSVHANQFVMRHVSPNVTKCALNPHLFTQIVTIFYTSYNLLIQLLQAVITLLLLRKLAEVWRSRDAMIASRRSSSIARREKIVAFTVAIISMMDLVILSPQYVAITAFAIDNILRTFSEQVKDFLYSIVNNLAVFDALLWCSNVFILLRVPAFRRQICHLRAANQRSRLDPLLHSSITHNNNNNNNNSSKKNKNT